MLPIRNSLQKQDTFRLKEKGWRKIYPARGNQKQAEVAICAREETDFK